MTRIQPPYSTSTNGSSSSILDTTHYAPRGFLINGKIVPSVTSNNLTVAIKGMDGNDPSGSNPVYIRIGDTVRIITSALSVTTNAGTNWFNAGATNTATLERDYFVYLGYNSTDGVVIGFSQVPCHTKYSNFSTTNTYPHYGAISTVTNASATDTYENIGRFAAILGATASFNWSVPTFTGDNLIQKPSYETRKFSWIPIYTGFSANPTQEVSCRVVNELCFVEISDLGNGTSNSGTFNMSMPFYNRGGYTATPIHVMDNGTIVQSTFRLVPDDITMYVYANINQGTFTTSGLKAVTACMYVFNIK